MFVRKGNPLNQDGTSKRSPRNFRAVWLAVEQLEPRRLLCALPHEYLDPAPVFDPRIERKVSADARGSGDAVSIVWTNRGTVGDGFASTFGANAATARNVIDRVLLDWSNAITSWNRADGTTTLQVSISMQGSGTGWGAAAGPAGSGMPADGKPRTGSMTIMRGNDTTGDGLGDGAGWYLDPRPADSAEFLGNIINAFSGRPTSTTSNFDLYTVASLELTHILGLITGPTGSPFNSYKLFTSGYTSVLTAPDTAEAGSGNTGSLGYFAKFDGPTIDHLMTTNNGGSGGSNWGSPIHTAGPGSTVINGVAWYGTDDSGNAVYDQARYLPNEVVLRMLSDAYGYSIVDPTTLPSFHAQLDISTGRLTVRGRDASNDIISVMQVGTKLRVSVDLGADVPGSGALPGAGDLPAYVSEFDLVNVNSIFIDGFGGNDNITVDVARPATVEGGAGADTIRVASVAHGTSNIAIRGGADNDQLYAGYNNNLDAIDADVTLDGGFGDDTIWYEDAFNPVASTYSINGNYLTRGGMFTVYHSNSEAVRAYLGSNGNIASIFEATVPTSIFGGNAADQFIVSSVSNTLVPFYHPLIVDGGGGQDTFDVRDTGQSNPSVYYLSSNTLERAGSAVMTFNAMEVFKLTATGATDEIRVRSTGSNVVYNLFSGANSDRIYIGDGTSGKRMNPIDGAIAIDGQGGNSDQVNFYDQDNASAATYTAGATSVYSNESAQISLANVEEAWFYGGTTGDTFNITPSSVIEYHLDGRGGTDTLNLNSAGATSPTQTPTSSSSGAWTFGNREPVYYTSIESNGSAPTNNPPTISSLSASPASITIGSSSTLTANGVADSDGTILIVYFYRENNGIAGFQTDDLFMPSDSTAPYTCTFNSTGLPAGTYTFYSRALDNGNALSNVVSTTVTVTAPGNLAPTISSLTSSSSSVIAGNAFRLTATGVNDPDGSVSDVRFFRETNGVAGLQLGGDTLIGTDVSVGDGWYTDVNTVGFTAGNYQYYAVARDNAGLEGNAVTTSITITTPAGPVPYYKTMFMEQYPVKVFFIWLEDVGASLDPGDLTVRNLATNQIVGVSEVTWDSANRAALFSLATYPPDGNYRATLSGTGVSANGVPMGTNVDVDFYILRGDANRDRRVDFNDLLVLAQNYGGMNKNFTQGNFDLDTQGKVDFSDLLLLAQRYGTSLSLAAPQVSVEQPAKRRVVTDVLN